MKLTKYIREAFVRAAMQDVPSVDYAEQVRSLADKAVKAAQAKVGLANVDQERLSRNWGYIHGSNKSDSMTLYAYGLSDDEIGEITKTPELILLMDKEEEQEAARQTLDRKLSAVIQSCNTRKQAVEALPEFEKYLPADTPPALRTLPVVANVVADFTKAGWPKGKK